MLILIDDERLLRHLENEYSVVRILPECLARGKNHRGKKKSDFLIVYRFGCVEFSNKDYIILCIFAEIA